jgi:class 3 adenylate cyclase
VVGTRKFAFDVWGDTVNLASQMETAAAPNRINVSAAIAVPDPPCASRRNRGKV